MVALFADIDKLTWRFSQRQATTQPSPVETGRQSDQDTAVNALEKWLKRFYQPRPAPWKRRTLLLVSLLILIAGSVAFMFLSGMPTEFWSLSGLFVTLAAIDVFTTVFGSDFWVAVILG